MNWRAILTAALAVTAIATGWSLWRQLAGPPAPVAGGRADYVLEDFELISLDATGRESFRLRGPRLSRDPAVRTLALVTPVFLIPPRPGATGAPWEVHSKTGWVSQKGDEIRLRGDVLATSSSATGQPIRIDTQQLNVFPDAKRATSAVAVSLRQPGLILNGHSMDARLDTQLVFLKDPKARYERSP